MPALPSAAQAFICRLACTAHARARHLTSHSRAVQHLVEHMHPLPQDNAHPPAFAQP